MSNPMTTPTDAQVEAALMRKPDRCPTCDCNWLVSTPAVIRKPPLCWAPLLEPPPEVHVYYQDVDKAGVYGQHSTREFADMRASPDRIACIRITWTEGQFDE